MASAQAARVGICRGGQPIIVRRHWLSTQATTKRRKGSPRGHKKGLGTQMNGPAGRMTQLSEAMDLRERSKRRSAVMHDMGGMLRPAKAYAHYIVPSSRQVKDQVQALAQRDRVMGEDDKLDGAWQEKEPGLPPVLLLPVPEDYPIAVHYLGEKRGKVKFQLGGLGEWTEVGALPYEFEALPRVGRMRAAHVRARGFGHALLYQRPSYKAPMDRTDAVTAFAESMKRRTWYREGRETYKGEDGWQLYEPGISPPLDSSYETRQGARPRVVGMVSGSRPLTGNEKSNNPGVSRRVLVNILGGMGGEGSLRTTGDVAAQQRRVVREMDELTLGLGKGWKQGAGVER